jgi:hypothetical protein
MTRSHDGRQGKFLGLPYDWRPMTRDRIRERAWNPDDPRIMTPHVYGWGLGVNWYQLFTRLKLIRR